LPACLCGRQAFKIMDIEDKCLLYIQAGPNRTLAKMIADNNRSSFVVKKVEDWYKSLPKKPLQKISEERKQITGVNSEEIKKMERERNELYRERDYLFAQLTLYKTDEERLNAALRILDLDDMIREKWQEIEYYTKTGKLVNKKTKEALYDNQEWLYKRLVTVRANISRDKKLNKDVSKWEEEKRRILNSLKYVN
jgi:type I site-specific restriction endonuclease